jgi:DNA invertase Pin-like site-specific DNA recombinase
MNTAMHRIAIRQTADGAIMIIGYARGSTNDQDLSSQLDQLKQAGATKIYKEKISGARSDRPELAKLMRLLNYGDVLLVTRLDRLARSTRDLLNVLDAVSNAGAAFKSLSDQWADTTTPHGRLMLTVLGGLAEFERELIRARTGEGRKRAMAAGVKFGRPRALSPHQQAEILKRRANGETLSVLAASYGVNRKTIMRLS